MYHGDIRLGETLDVKFTTTAASTGAPTTLSGTPVISAYPGNSTTQITAGITLTVDFDTVTGLNNVRVVATSGNGYATATNYSLVITTGTVGGTSAVGYVVGSFSIENRSAVMPTTAGRTLDVSAGGEAGVDWANVGGQTTSVNLSGTTTNVVNTASAVTTVNGLAANVITAAATAADFGTEVGTAVWASATRVLTANTNLNDPTAAAIADAVWDEARAGHTTAGSFGQGVASVQGDVTGNVDGSVASVTGAVGSVTGNVGGNVTGTIGGLSAAALADFFDTNSGTTYAAAVAGSVVKEIADNAGGSALTEAGIADAVWDELQAGHVGAGTFGEIATEIASILTDTAEIGAAGAGLTALASQSSVNTVDSNVDAIKAKTDSLNFTVAGQVDANIQYVNDTAVTGTGASGNEWGPA